MTDLCKDEELAALLNIVQSSDDNGTAPIDDLLETYPHDPRLHFLRGSVLASGSRLVDAYASMQRAVEIAPQYVLARFQLGFFELSSGEAAKAIETWKPLEDLPPDNYVHNFVNGLTHLIHDEFDAAVAHLRDGISRNSENPPLNNDMQLIIDKVAGLESEGERHENETSVSSTSVLLNQFSGPKTRH